MRFLWRGILYGLSCTTIYQKRSLKTPDRKKLANSHQKLGLVGEFHCCFLKIVLIFQRAEQLADFPAGLQLHRFRPEGPVRRICLRVINRDDMRTQLEVRRALSVPKVA